MKKYFFTGLVILLPLVLTILFAKFVINVLTKPFVGLVVKFLMYFDIINQTAFVNQPSVIFFIGQALSLVFFVIFVFILGWAGSWYVVKRLLAFTDHFFSKIPLVNKIYIACKDVVQNLFYSDKAAFQEVVLVPYPHKDILALGLITRDALVQEEGTKQELISVFVPATPNPTMGFILLFEKEKIQFTDITVRHALQIIVSCGAKVEEFVMKDVAHEIDSFDKTQR